jgi:uncharacterized protein with PIN domain
MTRLKEIEGIIEEIDKDYGLFTNPLNPLLNKYAKAILQSEREMLEGLKEKKTCNHIKNELSCNECHNYYWDNDQWNNKIDQLLKEMEEKMTYTCPDCKTEELVSVCQSYEGNDKLAVHYETVYKCRLCGTMWDKKVLDDM